MNGNGLFDGVLDGLHNGQYVDPVIYNGRDVVTPNKYAAFWKFKNPYPLNDSSGNGCRLTNVNNSVTFLDGKFGQEANFNGTTGRLTLVTPIASGTTFTISMWIKPIATGSNYANLLANINGGLFYRSSTKKISLYYGVDHFNNTPLTENVWTHIVVSVNAGNCTFYINGIANGTSPGVTNFAITNIGGDSANQYFKGMIDNVYIRTDKALSKSEAFLEYTQYFGKLQMIL